MMAALGAPPGQLLAWELPTRANTLLAHHIPRSARALPHQVPAAAQQQQQQCCTCMSDLTALLESYEGTTMKEQALIVVTKGYN